ncbi:MAG: hypothetical protein ACK4UN_17620, partial [Limisphaerales bacterium]
MVKDIIPAVSDDPNDLQLATYVIAYSLRRFSPAEVRQTVLGVKLTLLQRNPNTIFFIAPTNARVEFWN